MDPTELNEGDSLDLKYVSTHGHNPEKTISGEADEKEIKGYPKGGDIQNFVPLIVHVGLRTGETDNERPMYRLSFERDSEDDEWRVWKLSKQNGGRYHRVNKSRRVHLVDHE